VTGLERLSAAWRESYIAEATARSRSGEPGACVFCQLASEPVSQASGVVARSTRSFVCLNAFPYGSGHLLVLPIAHVASLGELDEAGANDLFALVRAAVAALTTAYDPDGFNVGFNLGPAAGAGIPGHLHAHVLPRWQGDTNFMTAIAETRVLPEALSTTWAKATAAWPPSPASPDR
jgi:diadenosine tetraphosphate (Ap4A) HIT family hydrolase